MISIFPAFGNVARIEGFKVVDMPYTGLWVETTWDYLHEYYGAQPATQSDSTLYGAFIVFNDPCDEVAFRLKYLTRVQKLKYQLTPG